MTKSVLRNSQAMILVFSLVGTSAVLAQSKWCCDNSQHGGATAEQRCENNLTVFAKHKECTAHKTTHDANTGHNSTCSGEVAQTRKGTVGGRARRHH
jgi:hypothetical protein